MDKFIDSFDKIFWTVLLWYINFFALHTVYERFGIYGVFAFIAFGLAIIVQRINGLSNK